MAIFRAHLRRWWHAAQLSLSHSGLSSLSLSNWELADGKQRNEGKTPFCLRQWRNHNKSEQQGYINRDTPFLFFFCGNGMYHCNLNLMTLSRNLRTALKCVSWLAAQSQISPNRANCAWMSPIFLWTNQNTQLCLTNHAAEKRERKISAFPSAYVRMWEIVVVAACEKEEELVDWVRDNFQKCPWGVIGKQKYFQSPFIPFKEKETKALFFIHISENVCCWNSNCNTLSLPSSFHTKSSTQVLLLSLFCIKTCPLRMSVSWAAAAAVAIWSEIFLSKRGFAEGVTG